MGIEPVLASEATATTTNFFSGYGLTAAGAISLAVSLIIAWLTHSRATKADENQNLVDRQSLINEAYQQVLEEVRVELSRRDTRHAAERTEWEAHETNLKVRIDELETLVYELREELASAQREGHIGRLHIDSAHIDHLDGPGSAPSG